MKKSILSLLIFPIIITAQSFENIKNDHVNGILFNGNDTYLIFDDGYLKISNEDLYEEYYRKIYNDSTIVNPNTELKSNFSFNLIPYIFPSNSNYDRVLFDKPLRFGILVNSPDLAGYSLNMFGQNLIDSLKTKE